MPSVTTDSSGSVTIGVGYHMTQSTNHHEAARVRILVGLVVCASVLTAGGQTLPAQPSAEPDGAILYRTYCASCHGVSGRGDGPMGEYLRVPAANLTHLARRHGGTLRDETVARVIDGRERVGAHGPTDMPVWGDAFTSPLAQGGEARLRARVNALVRYLASIQERPAP
jgi:mono/diheme cytochrome c family protein